MASFSAGTTFTDGVANDVTAAKLGALVNNATPTSGLIQDRTAETSTAASDTLLIGDSSDSNALKRITVANFAQTLPTAKITTGTIETGTFGTTTSTAESVTTGTITTLTAGTTTSTAATITTGTIPTLVATTLITSGTGTAAAPAIVPTGDTNNGLFFPAADNIAVSTNGTERVRIDASGNVGIGTTSPSVKLHVRGESTSSIRNDSTGTTINEYSQTINYAGNGAYLVQNLVYGNGLCVTAANPAVGQLYQIGTTSSTPVQFITDNTERLRIDSSGDVLVTSAVRIGYGSGSGGTVTQGTSKTTGVTLNKPTGQITMHNAALANGASVNFALTNSFISAVDTLLVNATAFGGYTVLCVNTATGAATIRVTNISGGSLSEAVTIQFAVIKGAAA